MLGKIARNGLRNLSCQTALLEACNWDQEEANRVCDYVADFLNNLSLSNEPTWEEFVSGVGGHIKQVYGENIGGIIINMLETSAKEIVLYMEAPDA